MTSTKWDRVIPQAVEQARKYKSEYNEAPTLRGIYYSLVSIMAIPNTKSAYKGLSRTLTAARIAGSFPWNLMQDKTREATEEGKETLTSNCVKWAGEAVEDALEALDTAFTQIEDPSINYGKGKWAGQPNRVLIAVEKEAIMGAISNVLQKWDVQVYPLRGYTSTTFMKEMADQLRKLARRGDVKLIIVTDYDPSGEDMVRDIQDRLSNDYGVDVDAEKVLLTRAQIDEYDLPAIPEDAEEIAKIRRDPRFATWNEGIFRVELDAMAAIHPPEFRRIMNEAVEQHFDTEIDEEDQSVVDAANEEAEEELRDLYEKLRDIHTQVRDKIAEIQEEG